MKDENQKLIQELYSEGKKVSVIPVKDGAEETDGQEFYHAAIVSGDEIVLSTPVLTMKILDYKNHRAPKEVIEPQKISEKDLLTKQSVMYAVRKLLDEYRMLLNEKDKEDLTGPYAEDKVNRILET